jgi:hypothetical protein
MDKKNMLVLAGVIAAVIAGILIYKSLPAIERPPADTEKPIIVGGLVGIGPSTITVKAKDGTEMEFIASSKTPVFSQVKEGEAGRVYEQLSVGDVLAVTADASGTRARKLEILPVGRAPVSGEYSVMLTGTVVSVGTSSLVIRLPAPNPAMAVIAADLPVRIDEDTDVLTRVLGIQTGKALREFAPGAQVSVEGTSDNQGIAARSILLLLAR